MPKTSAAVTPKADPAIVALARSYWGASRRYYCDGANRLGFPTGPLRDGHQIVWCVPGAKPGLWIETGGTLTPEGASSIGF